MGESTFSAVLMRNPQKAAQQLARYRHQIAQVDAGKLKGVHVRRDELVKHHDRIERACRDTGRCCECGKALTDPESLARGIGPDCVRKVHRLAVAEDFARAHRQPPAGIPETGEPF